MSNCISSSQFITFFLKKSIPLYSPSILKITPHHLHACPLILSISSNKYNLINKRNSNSNSNSHPTLILPPRATTATTPMSTFTTPPEFPSRRIREVDPSTPPEMPQILTTPNEFIIPNEPEIKPPVPPPDPIPNPPGPDLPEQPIPSPPGPDIYPPPEAPPPHQPPDVVPPTPPDIFPPPSTPPPDIIPPTGPMIV